MTGNILSGITLLIYLLLQYCCNTSAIDIPDTRHRDAAPFTAYGDKTDVELNRNYKTGDDDEGILSVKFMTCMAKVNEGTIDLRKLSGDNGIPRFMAQYMNWTYTFDPCMTFNLPQDPYIGFGDKCRYVTVCKSKTTPKRSFYYALGTMEHSEIDSIYFPHLGNHHLGISYRGMRSHRERSVHIALICDATLTLPTDAVFTIIQDAPKKDTYGELRHKCACVNGCADKKEENPENKFLSINQQVFNSNSQVRLINSNIHLQHHYLNISNIENEGTPYPITREIITESNSYKIGARMCVLETIIIIQYAQKSLNRKSEIIFNCPHEEKYRYDQLRIPEPHCTLPSRDDDEIEGSFLNDTTLTVLILIVVGLLMIAMLIGGLCYNNTTPFKPYQKISGRWKKQCSGVTQLDDEPRQSQSKKTVLPVLDCCVIPANKLHTGHRLGGGIFADTYVGKYGDWTISVKRLTLVIHQNQLTAPVIEWMKKEVGHFGKQRHRNIVSVLGLCLETRLPCIINEFVDGMSVKEYMRSSYKSMTWPMRARICLQAADGLAFLHSCKPPIFHRDVRCANIFITDQDIVKVADFGVTKLLQPLRDECRKEECVCQRAYSACASSVRWTAPEVLRNPTAGENDQKYTVMCDVYSFGVAMWELAHNRDPYPDVDTEGEVATRILNGTRPNIAETIEMQPEYLFLMNHCWNPKPTERPKFKDVAGKCKEILHHSRPFQKQIMYKVQYDPEQDIL